jgi:hypothetical protein
MEQFIPQVETNLKSNGLDVLLVSILNDNVQRHVKHKLDFDESKSISRPKPS